MKNRTKSLLSFFPRLMIAVGVLLFFAGAITWENVSWRRAYSAVSPGMEQSVVEDTFKQLRPEPRSCEYGLGGFWKRDAYAYLVIAGPNRWKYVFYLDPSGKVVHKAKWWG